jgi:LPXTG-motif cell wall-anchored protein
MSSPRITAGRLLAAAFLCVACAAVMMAQVKTTTTEQKGAPEKKVTVERGEVVYVSGNEVVVKMENGEVRHVTVPDSATAVVDGKTITLKDLKPGMKLQRTLVTTATPKTVQTVRTGTGTVIAVQAPNYATVRFEDGEVQRYKIPKGTKFTIDGQQKTAFDLKPGMKISATRIVEAPVVEVSEQKIVTGSAPPAPPPPPPPPDVPILIAEAPKPAPAPAAEPAPAPAPAPAAEPAPKKLPKTGSMIPMVGLMGLLFSGASFGLRLLRRS